MTTCSKGKGFINLDGRIIKVHRIPNLNEHTIFFEGLKKLSKNLKVREEDVMKVDKKSVDFIVIDLNDRFKLEIIIFQKNFSVI